MKKCFIFYLTLFLVLALASPSMAGSISGRVTFGWKASVPKKIKVNRDKRVCGKEKTSEELLVGKDGGIRDVVVRVKGASGGKWSLGKEVKIDQKGCRFNPHVTLMKPGATLTVTNPDGITHSIRTFSIRNPSISKAQPKFKKKIKIKGKLNAPETIKLVCDIHKKWMSAWIIVADSPYIAVTGADGSFKIDNIPPGDYILEVWQERLGSQRVKVSVEAGGDTEVSVNYE